MAFLIFFTVVCLIGSLAVDQQRTFEGFRRGLNMFLNVLPALLLILILVSVMLYLIPEPLIIESLGKRSGVLGVLIAALVGAIALIPPFIAFPLAGILLGKGVSYTVVAVFVTSLIMVGFVTLPIEFRYFGKKAALWRNGLSLIAAIVIGVLIGFFL